uniref:Uncharacterized protein n=1 Tax=Siphoviridae sp. ct3q24 TaxID=2827772 RepID=A0A8S5SE61_9CAUD|nr:MAG TPA: Protein of unknown function (DUF3039) [Siphoviridae sp. ct3q24]
MNGKCGNWWNPKRDRNQKRNLLEVAMRYIPVPYAVKNS